MVRVNVRKPLPISGMSLLKVAPAEHVPLTDDPDALDEDRWFTVCLSAREHPAYAPDSLDSEWQFSGKTMCSALRILRPGERKSINRQGLCLALGLHFVGTGRDRPGKHNIVSRMCRNGVLR